MPSSHRAADILALKYSAGGPPATRVISQRVGAAVAWLAAPTGISPSLVTLSGAVLFVLGAWAYAALPAGPAPLLASLLLLQLAYALDCADGQLARATGRTSAFGAWLDLACDHVRNIALALGVAAWLIGGHGIAPLLAVVPAGVLAAGFAVQLHTLATVRQADPGGPAAQRNNVRRLLTALIDTPVFLLLLCLLRDLPLLLGGFVALMGMAYLGAGTLQARRRLAPRTP